MKRYISLVAALMLLQIFTLAGCFKTSSPDLDKAAELLRRGLPEQTRSLISPDGNLPTDSAGLALYGESYETEGNWLRAVETWKKALTQFPEADEFQLHQWQSLLALAEEDSVISDSLKKIIRGAGEKFGLESSFSDMKRAYWAAALTGDSLADPRGDRLIDAFPDSQDVIDLVGERFWDGLYPIWRNDSAKVVYLSEFIEKYSAFSWKNTAWRSLIGAHGSLGDTVSAVKEAVAWVNSADADPYVLLTAATFMMDYNEPDSARTWAERAYQLKANLERPSHVPAEEWQLYGPQIRAGIPLKLSQIYLEEKKLEEAKILALESLKLAVYGADEYATPAAQHYQLGRIFLASGDTSAATDHLVKALLEGEVRNRNPSFADSILRQIHGIENGDKLIEFCRTLQEYNGISFTRVTDEAGLTGVRGSRFAWGDYDNDGDDDLLVGGKRLFRNDNGHFTDVSDSTGLKAPGCHGGIWGDYDRDGDLDLFCFSSSNDSGKTERLFRNTGNGMFEDVTAVSGNITDKHSTEAAIWADLNCDGRLDLFVAGYERPAGSASDLGNGWEDRLLIQDENGLFHDRSESSGMIPPYGRHLCGRSPVTCDFDRDGDLDLYVGNYRLQQNLFWVNDGRGNFVNKAAWFKVDGEEVDGWWGHGIGCQWGDFDNDGDFDLIVGNLAHPRYIKFSNRTMLYRNDGKEEGFKDVRHAWGIKYDECHSETMWGDLDNDGDLDLFITSVYPDRRSYLYRNDGDRFIDVTYLAGVRIFNGWGCALSDYDNDGDLDLITRNSGKIDLFRNDTEGGNWLELTVTNDKGYGNNPIGLIVEAVADGKLILRQIEGGKGAGSQSSQALHFGLGQAEEVYLTIFSSDEKMELQPDRVNEKIRFNLK